MEEPSILVVEDNPTLQKMVSLMANRRGVNTVIVGTCTEAIVAVESGQAFALILMDWSLPDRTGLECTGCIRNILTSNVPIVAMTGHTMPGDREACFAAGMDDYLSKPFTFDEFNRLLNRWMTVAPAPDAFPLPTDAPRHPLPPTM